MATNILTPSIVESVDALASTATTYTLAVGQTAQGVLSSYSDQDWYRVNLTAGQVYSFAVIGTGSTPLTDTYLYLENASGVQLASNNDGGPHASSIITYTALTSGTYYLNIANNWTVSGQYGAGQYGLSVTTGTKPNFDFSMSAGAVDARSSWANSTGTTGSTVITYGFRDTAATYTEPGSNIASFIRLTSAEISAVNLALKLWSDVAGIQFVQVNPGGYTNNATILLGNYSDSADGAGAFALYPGSTVASSSSGDVWLNTANSISQTNANVGTYTFQTILHELGHAIGLSHPGDYNATPGVTFTYANSAQFLQDSEQYSVMSYFGATSTGAVIPTNDVGTPLMFDILALQNIYGANMTTRMGDTVYGFGSNAGSPYDFASNSAPQFCIWDAGGSDTLNCSGFSQSQAINLSAGAFSDVGGYKANVSIALGVVIENAVGGSGDDVITGNATDNVLTGNGGDDRLIGGGGIDTAAYSSNFHNYTISFFSSDGHIQVQDKVLSRDGIDSDYAISSLQFSDLTLNNSISGAAGGYQAAFTATCSSSVLASSLDSLQSLCSSNLLSAITRSDKSALTLAASTFTSDTQALAKTNSLANLFVADTLGNLNNLDLSPLSNGQQVTFKLSALDTNATINASGHLNLVDLSGLSGASFSVATLSNQKDSLITITQSGVSRSLTLLGELPTSFAVSPVTIGDSGAPYTITTPNLSIVGSAKTDMVSFSGTSSNFAISLAGSQTAIVDSTGSMGVTNLNSVERLQFSDMNIALDIGSTQNGGMAYELYQAAFNRTPDLSGLGFWIHSLDVGININTVAQNFITSPEFSKLYGANPSAATLINGFYQNALHRAPDTDGYNYWMNVLGTDNMYNRAAILENFASSPENVTNVAAQIANGISFQAYIG